MVLVYLSLFVVKTIFKGRNPHAKEFEIIDFISHKKQKVLLGKSYLNY